MLGKIHSTTGNSFRGVAEYLLDVLREKKDSRVAWVETRNLGTQDGLTAARVMAATAMQHDELKAAAGIQSKRKMQGPVMHLSISWREDEVENLTREKMLEVADLAISKFGKDSTRGKNVPKHGGRRQFGDQHQAMIVCHDDKSHPHVHIVINRVHPEHGVLLPSSYDRLKLSKVGLKFEKENNKVVCVERVVNWQARDNGSYVKAEPEIPRKTWEKLDNLKPELEKKARLLMEQERKKAASIAQSARDQKARHQADWGKLQERHFDRATGLVEAREKHFKEERRKITKQMLQVRREQLHEKQADLAAFELREKTAIGKLKNRMKGIDLKSLVGLDKSNDPDGRAKTWSEAFNILGSSGAALQSLKSKHEINQKRTNRQERREVRQAESESRQDFKANLAQHRDTLQQERGDLIFRQRAEKSKTKAEWKTFEATRSTHWEPLQAPKGQPKANKPARRTQNTTSSPRTNVSNVLPKSKRGAQLIDSRKQQILDAARKQSRNRSTEADKSKERGDDGGNER